MKNTFFKNLFDGLSALGIVIMFELPGLLMLLYSDAPRHVISIIIFFMIGAPLLYFVFGSYFLFQTVVVDNFGIRVKIFSKTIRNIPWEKVELVEAYHPGRGTVIRVIVRGEAPLWLDWRKKIRNAIEAYRPKIDPNTDEQLRANSLPEKRTDQRHFFPRPLLLVLQVSGAIALDSLLIVFAFLTKGEVALTLLATSGVLFLFESLLFGLSFLYGWNAMVSIDSTGVSKRFGSKVVSLSWDLIQLEEVHPRSGLRKMMRLKVGDEKSILLECVDSIFILLETYCTNATVLDQISSIRGGRKKYET